MKTEARLILIVLAAAVGVGGAVMWWANSRVSADSNRSMEAAASWPIECPPDTEPSVETWALSGYSVSCRLLKGAADGNPPGRTGPFYGFKQGRLVVSGHLKDGMQVGEWVYFDESGAAVKRVRQGE